MAVTCDQCGEESRFCRCGAVRKEDTSWPLPGMKIVPMGIRDDPFMAGMWYGFLRFSIAEPGCLEAFKKATGIDLKASLPHSAMDRMIDSATGHTDARMAAFCGFVTAQCWGIEGEDGEIGDEQRPRDEGEQG